MNRHSAGETARSFATAISAGVAVGAVFLLGAAANQDIDAAKDVQTKITQLEATSPSADADDHTRLGYTEAHDKLETERGDKWHEATLDFTLFTLAGVAVGASIIVVRSRR